jgi:hypothetical protein
MVETLEEFDETRGKTDIEEAVAKTHNSSRDLAIENSGVSRSVHQLCVIITEAAEEDNHEGNIEVDLQVDKSRNTSKKEKEKIHVSTGEWRIIMSAINHGTEVPRRFKERSSDGVPVRTTPAQKEAKGGKRHVHEKLRR